MPEFSDRSLRRLSTVHPDLQILFQEVVKHFDCTVVSGLRTLEEQQALYAKGRPEGNIVTYADGVERRSNHQSGNAVDVVPYPSGYSDAKKIRDFGWYVLGVAQMLKSYGAIDNDIKWGGKWKRFKDYPHFEI